MKKNILKTIGIALTATVLSTLGIFASDTIRGIDRDIGNLANVQDAGGCKSGTTQLKIEGYTLCIDVYEASPSKGCTHAAPSNVLETEQNANTKDCFAVSVKDAQPWTFVSLSQAQRMCAAGGKRLPTNKEWYHLVLGTPSDACVTNASGAQKTGSSACVSNSGAIDAVGNVWEWVDETVTSNTFDGRTLPEEGFVTSVDNQGIAISSGENPDALYGKDYFWSKSEGVFGMIRGGFYGSGDDAGLYTTNASVLTSFAAQGVGFRCVEDL